MRIVSSDDRRRIGRLVDRRPVDDPAVARRVASIVEAVRTGGDVALQGFARRLDRLRGDVEVTRAEIEERAAEVPRDVRAALRTAARNIRAVARRQVPRPWRARVAPGVTIEQRVTPLDRVACYVPGGRYPLPSTLLMTAIPARVAGVREVIVVCPHPEAVVMAAAIEAGVDRLFRIGGAHAVAALAYGTPSVPRVDKIVGPGSAYVAAAKALVARDCAIDFYAGPSEILAIASAGRADWIAADLVAQAEHDPDARAIFITPNRTLARQVARAVARRLPAAGPAAAAIRRNGAIILTRSIDEAIALANRMAPEHLVCDDERIAVRVTSAGTVFVGAFAAQAAGDYATGSNHVLPTSGAARARGGLSAADFVRVATIQRLTRAGLRSLAPAVVALARAEGLEAHAASIDVRLR
jgi:histidinol dehydrogenase